jgi:hypothetical protein
MNNVARAHLRSARVSRAGESGTLSRTFVGAPPRASGAIIKRLFRRDAEISTRDACTTQT